MDTPSFILRGFGPVIALFAAFLTYAGLFRWLDRRCGLANSLRTHVNRLAPAFLIFAPPIITYGLVCGFLSLSYGVFCDSFFAEKISDRQSFYLPVFHAFEYVSGVGMSYLWIRFVRWLGLKPVWYVFIVASHGLVAGYREARSDYGGNVMGPTVSDHFVVLDALIPFLAFLVYGLLHSRKHAAEQTGSS